MLASEPTAVLITEVPLLPAWTVNGPRLVTAPVAVIVLLPETVSEMPALAVMLYGKVILPFNEVNATVPLVEPPADIAVESLILPPDCMASDVRALGAVAIVREEPPFTTTSNPLD